MSKSELVGQYVKKFPDTPTLTLSKLIYKENNALFKDVEAVRDLVRYVRGNKGDNARKYATYKRTNGKPGDIFQKLPKPTSHWGKWAPVNLKFKKALLIGDLHVPFHDMEACQVAFENGYKQGVDAVIINGDFVDFWSISRWEKNPKFRDFPGELEKSIQMLEAVRQGFPDQQIIFKVGNHEERYDRYMQIKAPELLGVKDFELENILKFDDLNIKCVRDMKPMKAGKLFVIHGHEYRFNISNPVNPARGVFLRAKDYCITHHFHQSSKHNEPTIGGKKIATWSVGCLCDLHPDYMPLNKWNHGFAIIDMFDSQNFKIDNIDIINGKVY